MIEITIDSVRMGMVNTQRVVMLKEKGGQRRLSIALSAAEADPIITALKSGTDPHRGGNSGAEKDTASVLPLTHDLVTKIIATYNGRVKMAVINAAGRDRYYASLIVAAGDGEARFDCRTTDAVALAIRADAPVFIEEAILDSGSAAANVRRSSNRALISTDDIKCPECGGKTTIRTAAKGLNAGKKFHVCNQYPECKGKVSIQYRSH